MRPLVTLGRGALASLLCFNAPALVAQWRVDAWVGMAWETRTVVGDIRDRDLLLTTFGASHPVAQSGPVRLRYVVAIVPVAVVTVPNCWATLPGTCSARASSQSRWRYGAGVAPVGATLELRTNAPVSAVVHGQAGSVWFTTPVPVDSAGRFNFFGSIGAGAAVHVPVGQVTVGYRLVHLSNGGLAEQNPGLNAKVWWLGWSP